MKLYVSPLLIIVSAFSLSTFAALGDRDNLIEVDQKKLDADHQSEIFLDYTVHSMNGKGNLVKEFVNMQNRVFAVSWRGIKTPDFKTLFGSSYGSYARLRSLQGRVPGHRHIAINSENIVVSQQGHMGDFHGLAYLPKLVPRNVNIEDLRP